MAEIRKAKRTLRKGGRLHSSRSSQAARAGTRPPLDTRAPHMIAHRSVTTGKSHQPHATQAGPRLDSEEAGEIGAVILIAVYSSFR